MKRHHSKSQLSERDLAKASGLARDTVRKCLRRPEECRLGNIMTVASVLEKQVIFALAPSVACDSSLSVVAISCAIARDGFDSWKIHLFNFVDALRRTLDERLILLPPISDLDKKLRALIQSVVISLAQELHLNIPKWAKTRIFLEEPWFVAGVESLKASALLESGIEFRRNNIFVLSNFLSRV